MLERLNNQRVFLFRRKETFTPGLVKWELVRRIKPFPIDLSELSFFNYLFSPNMMHYLDYNREKRQFIIRNSLDQTVHLELDKLIKLTDGDEEAQRTQIASTFKWVNN